MPTKILATASYVPETRRTNADLERMLGTDLNNGGTTDKWIMERVGIKERRIGKPHEDHFYMAFHAVKKAIEKAGVHPENTSIILAGNTHVPGLVPCHASLLAAAHQNTAAWDVVAPDVSPANDDAEHLFGSKSHVVYHHVRQSLAQVIAKELGMNAKYSYDVVTGCASFNFALALADARIQGKPQYVVVVGVDKMNGVVNEKDRASVVLFGELAGAAVLGPSKDTGFVYHHLDTDGTQRDLITIKQESGWDKPYFWQDGKAVYKWAVSKIIELTQKTVDTAIADICPGRVFIVPHQANPRMLESAMKKEIFKKVYGTVVTGDMFGNSSTASIAHALDVALTEGVPSRFGTVKPSRGDYVGILGFGAGLSSAVNVYRVA